MTVTLFAQPYDVTAWGFYFEDAEQFKGKSTACHNDFGDPVEEFEIQFIDGEEIDCCLAEAWGVNQANFSAYLDAVEDWDEDQKRRYIIAVGECGYDHSQVADDPESVDLVIYEADSLRGLAEQFVDEGVFGDIPERLSYYIDYDAIARDLSVEFSETVIAGERLIYECR